MAAIWHITTRPAQAPAPIQEEHRWTLDLHEKMEVLRQAQSGGNPPPPPLIQTVSGRHFEVNSTSRLDRETPVPTFDPPPAVCY